MKNLKKLIIVSLLALHSLTSLAYPVDDIKIQKKRL